MNKDEQRPTVTVSATVKSKAQEEDGYRIELVIPSFGGQYPTAINRVPAEIASKLITGRTYTLTLERQNLRKKKDGTSYDGFQPWMYWYGLDDVPDQDKVRPEDASYTPPESDAGVEERTPAPLKTDRQDLIMLQHASGVVAQAYGDWMRLPPGTRGKFNDHLKNIALAATWYLRYVYQQGGYASASPQEGQGEGVEAIDYSTVRN